MNVTVTSQIIPMSEYIGEDNEYTRGQYAIEATVYVDGREAYRDSIEWLNQFNATIHQQIFERSVLNDAK